MKENIHVGIEKSGCIESKKDMLLCEKGLLEIAQHMQSYRDIRKIEHALKNAIRADLDAIRKEMEKIHAGFPKENIHLKEAEAEEKKKEIKEIPKARPVRKKTDIERQLDDIQEKLARL
jgi:Fe-S-cluster-containing hydrogenase component 2